MSLDPLAYPAWPYSGTPFFQPVNPAFKATAGPMGPRIVPLSFDWNVYFTALNGEANIAVPINLAGGQVQGGILDKIVMVKIDNQNSTIPISVYFPDTQDMVSCAPQSVVTVPAMTNDLRCVVIAQGLQAGFLPKTKVYLYNFLSPSVIDPQLQYTYPQEIGSPLIQRNQNRILTPGYASRALGDQITFNQWQQNNSGVRWDNIFGTPNTGYDFVYLTHANVKAFNVLNSGPATVTFFMGNDIGDQIFFWQYTAGVTELDHDLMNLQGANIKLDANRRWFIQQTQPNGGALGGWINATFVFSLSNL